MPPKTSRDIDGQKPRKDRDREQQDAVVQDADDNEQSARDGVHGDGEGIEWGIFLNCAPTPTL